MTYYSDTPWGHGRCESCDHDTYQYVMGIIVAGDCYQRTAMKCETCGNFSVDDACLRVLKWWKSKHADETWWNASQSNTSATSTSHASN